MNSDDMIGSLEDKKCTDWVKVKAMAKKNGGLHQSKSADVCVSLRQLQYRRGCSNALLEDVLETMRPYLQCLAPRNFSDEDKKMQVRRLFSALLAVSLLDANIFLVCLGRVFFGHCWLCPSYMRICFFVCRKRPASNVFAWMVASIAKSSFFFPRTRAKIVLGVDRHDIRPTASQTSECIISHYASG